MMLALWIIALSLLPIGLLAWGCAISLTIEWWKEKGRKRSLQMWERHLRKPVRIFQS